MVVDGETWFTTASVRIHLPVERRARVMCFRDGLLFPASERRQNLRYGALRTSAAAPARANIPFEQVTELLGLTPLLGHAVPTLSGGEKQRVAIGRALLSQ